MPPKKIKLITKEKIVKPEIKEIKEIIVDSDEIDRQDLGNPARKGDEEKVLEVKELDVKEEDEKDVKEDKVEDKVEVNEKEEQKTIKSDTKKSESSQKTKKPSVTRDREGMKPSQMKPSSETSFDMFGSNNIDYRETMLNYDCSKNKTLPKLTKYEIALVIGKRAKQIEDGANPNIKVMPGKNSIEIAEEELRQGVIPFYIKRPIGNSFELFKLADMEFYLD
jgi:DNA-directed RNA polymerase subunit K/omega